MGRIKRQLDIGQTSRIVFFGRKRSHRNAFERRFRIKGDRKGGLRFEKHRPNLRGSKFLSDEKPFPIGSIGHRNQPVLRRRVPLLCHAQKDSGGLSGIGEHGVVERSGTENAYRWKYRRNRCELGERIGKGSMGLAPRFSQRKRFDGA